MTPESKALLTILKAANVDDGMAQRGVTLTDKGKMIVARKLRCTTEEVDEKLSALSVELESENARDPMAEGHEHTRYSFESDILGNVTLRDAKTGAEKHLVGDEAFKLLQAITISSNYQPLLAPYFALKESTMWESTLEEAILEEDGFADEMDAKRGTYNFPFGAGAGTALYGMRDGDFQVQIVSLRDREGEELDITDAMRKDAEQKALRFIDSV